MTKTSTKAPTSLLTVAQVRKHNHRSDEFDIMIASVAEHLGKAYEAIQAMALPEFRSLYQSLCPNVDIPSSAKSYELMKPIEREGQEALKHIGFEMPTLKEGMMFHKLLEVAQREQSKQAYQKLNDFIITAASNLEAYMLPLLSLSEYNAMQEHLTYFFVETADYFQ